MQSLASNMVSRSFRTCLLFTLLAYLFLLLIFSRNFFLEKCWNRNGEPALLELTIEVNNNDGHGKTDKLKISVDNRGKELETNNETGKEVVFIKKNERNIHSDKRTIQLTNQEHIIFEARQKLYDTSTTNKNKPNDVLSVSTVNKQYEEHIGKQKKYIFSLRYYEQLSMATKNLLSLASLATNTNRHVVMPFVNNSRFSGVQTGASMTRFMEIQGNANADSYKFSNLSTYFDIQHLNNELKDHGYTQLASFQEFKQDCSTLDIVIQFLYEESQNLEKWYKLPKEKIKEIRKRVKNNGGVAECKFLRRSKISIFLGRVNATKYVCVDPEIIKSPEDFQNKVLQDAKCTGIIFWKGIGRNRAHFPLAPNISEMIRPSNLKHNSRLTNIAYSYIRDIIKRPFISVHVRSERHLIRKGVSMARNCIKKLTKNVLKRREAFHLKKIFVSSDFEEHGSDTLLQYVTTHEREQLQSELLRGLENPYTFNPSDYNLFDRGEIAIIEMHILSMGESLFTLGRGNFQAWIMDLFLFHNAEDKSLIYKVCEFETKGVHTGLQGS